MDTPEKFEAPEIVRVRFLPLGGICHVVGSTTDILSMESIDSSLDACEFLHEQDFPFLRHPIFSLRIRNGKHPPIIKRKATRIRATTVIVPTTPNTTRLTTSTEFLMRHVCFSIVVTTPTFVPRLTLVRHVKISSLWGNVSIAITTRKCKNEKLRNVKKFKRHQCRR